MFVRQKQCESTFVLILFILLHFHCIQTTSVKFRSSNIEIIPNLVIINSTSSVNFTCFNYQSNETPLEVHLSKIIPTDQIKVSTKILNKTTIHIQLESINYVGIFHLLCYSNGEPNKGTRADIIVKAAPGILQLTERCRVFDRQFIKCIIRAPTIARAVQNDYPIRFEFNEISHSPDRLVYWPRFEFLRNESTNDYLVFKWKPTVDGEFPSGVRMHMQAMLPHFDTSEYYFDMTPVFQITPKFILQAISSSEIQINLKPISPAAICEKSILPKLTSNINQTWTILESDRNNIRMNNLASNTIYRICMKCRQVFTDPEGIEECRDMKTLNKFAWFSQYIYIIIGLLIVVIAITIVLIIFYKKKQRKGSYAPVERKENGRSNRRLNSYASSQTYSGDSISNGSPEHSTAVSTRISSHQNHDSRTDPYHSIANLSDVIAQCSPPERLPILED